MLNKNTLRLVSRRTLLTVLIVLTALVQYSASGIFQKLNFGVFLLIPLCISIAMYEKEFAGLFFGVLTGALWDLASPVTDGVYALLFAVLACGCGLLSHYVIRNTFKSALLLTSIATVLFLSVTLLFNCLFKDYSGVEYFIRRFSLFSFIATLIASPFLYFGITLIEKQLRSEDTYRV